MSTKQVPVITYVVVATKIFTVSLFVLVFRLNRRNTVYFTDHSVLKALTMKTPLQKKKKKSEIISSMITHLIQQARASTYCEHADDQRCTVCPIKLSAAV